MVRIRCSGLLVCVFAEPVVGTSQRKVENRLRHLPQQVRSATDEDSAVGSDRTYPAVEEKQRCGFSPHARQSVISTIVGKIRNILGVPKCRAVSLQFQNFSPHSLELHSKRRKLLKDAQLLWQVSWIEWAHFG